MLMQTREIKKEKCLENMESSEGGRMMQRKKN